MRIIEAVLQQYPNVKVIQGTNDSGAIGGYRAVMNSGRAGDETFYVGGADATDEAIAAMKEEGSVFRMSIDLAPYDTGRQCADKMFEYVNNGTPKEPEVFLFPMRPVWQQDVIKN
jgi:ribose transport system substrate-binding protein